MRWDSLFEDLEAQADAAERADFEAELVDLVRAERAAVSLRQRILAHVGRPVRCTLVDGDTLSGAVGDVGADWLLLTTGAGDVLVPQAALAWLGGLSAAAGPDEGAVVRRLGIASVLRGLAGRRAALTVELRGGMRLTGTVARVGADHFDVAVHPLDEPPRRGSVTDVHVVPTASVLRILVR